MNKYKVHAYISNFFAKLAQSGKWRGTRGISLIEIIVVLGLVVMIGGIGAFMGLDSLRGYLFRSDTEVIVMLLQHARAQAMGAVCTGSTCVGGAPHGLFVGPSTYTVFQGSSFATRDTDADATTDANPHFVHGGISEIVFATLSGTTTGGTITLTNDGRISTIAVNPEGQIIWSN